MDYLMEPSTEAAITWLKDRLISMRVPASRKMVEKAIKELKYRCEEKPVEINSHYGGQFVPACPNCEFELYDDYDYCPKCGQAIDWSALEEEQ